jgi:hypothetical protein
VIGLHRTKFALQDLQPALLLVKLGRLAWAQGQHVERLLRLLDTRLQLSDALWSARFDAVILAFLSHVNRIEPARCDAKALDKASLEFVE